MRVELTWGRGHKGVMGAGPQRSYGAGASEELLGRPATAAGAGVMVSPCP